MKNVCRILAEEKQILFICDMFFEKHYVMEIFLGAPKLQKISSFSKTSEVIIEIIMRIINIMNFPSLIN